MGALAVGKMLLGQIFDKMGTRSAIVIACGCIMLGLFGLVAVKFAPAILLVVVGSGLGCAFGTVAYPILTTSMFGSKDYSNIYGIISVMTSLGPVSYTHLDVYKRQGRQRAPPGQGGHPGGSGAAEAGPGAPVPVPGP